MKALLLLPMLILTLIMTGCGMNPSTPTTTQTGNAVAPAYTVTHTPMGESNGEHIIVSLDSKPIFAKLPENELGSFQALV
jgi:ABC-type Fe3+-hydroxamate transport system substrate-binding protein